MTEKITIKGTNTRCKDPGVVGDRFNKIPMDILTYQTLGLHNSNDLAIWIKLYELDHNELGYAYPTIDQLMLYTNLGRKTVIECIKNLERTGLIKKAKSKFFKNHIYFIYKPLSKEELYAQAPETVKQYEERKAKILKIAEDDLKRLRQLQKYQQQLP